jgi:hypothetical protein
LFWFWWNFRVWKFNINGFYSFIFITFHMLSFSFIHTSIEQQKKMENIRTQFCENNAHSFLSRWHFFSPPSSSIHCMYQLPIHHFFQISNFVRLKKFHIGCTMVWIYVYKWRHSLPY